MLHVTDLRNVPPKFHFRGKRKKFAKFWVPWVEKNQPQESQERRIILAESAPKCPTAFVEIWASLHTRQTYIDPKDPLQWCLVEQEIPIAKPGTIFDFFSFVFWRMLFGVGCQEERFHCVARLGCRNCCLSTQNREQMTSS